MQFNTKFQQMQTLNLNLDNFKGVDYANTPFNVAKHRAVEMRNLIYRDGVNRKRYGWNEIFNLGERINGYWEFTDTYGVKHTIIHGGNKIYKYNPLTNTATDITNTATYKPSYVDTQAEWNNKLINSITDEISWGIVRSNRLYILCGIYLVYGTWDNGNTYELRIVEDNEDTYIPTTTIGIANVNSVIANTRASHDEVNMLSSRRRNKLIGENANVEINITKVSDTYAYEFGGYIQSVNNELHENLVSLKINIKNDNSIYNITRTFPLSSTKQTFIFNDSTNQNDFLTNGYGWYDGENGGDLNSFFAYMSLTYQYVDNQLYVKLAYYFKPNKENTEVNINATQTLKYYLDTTNIDDEEIKVYHYNTLVSNAYYSVDRTEGSITFTKEFLPKIAGQNNLIVEFSKKVNGYADKVNGCKFGIMFGYNEQEYLFISGNDNYPNMDFHTTNRDASETPDTDITLYEDLTYFGDLGYATVGSQVERIIGYTLLGDSTLAIHKTYSHNEPSLYIRQAILGNATDSAGNIIYDQNNNPFQNVYFPQYASAIGEGVISPYSINNLSGDNLFLSKNGVYALVLSSNIKSNERYARERSRLINNRLTKEKGLENAVAIVYEGRYYLAVNNRVYVADSRFMTRLDGEAEDTFSYEWWVWDNCPVRIWFIKDGALCFGTNEGRICKFGNNFKDTYSQKTISGAITLDFNESKFIYAVDDYSSIADGSIVEVIDDDETPRLYELIMSRTKIRKIENNKIFVDSDTFTNYIRYFEEKIVYIEISGSALPLSTNVEYIITNLDYANFSFELIHKTTQEFNNQVESIRHFDELPDIFGFKINDEIYCNGAIYKLKYIDSLDKTKGSKWVNVNYDYLKVKFDNIIYFDIVAKLSGTSIIKMVGEGEFKLLSYKDFDNYVKTKDTEIDENKTYYTKDINGNYEEVETPNVDEIDTYYEFSPAYTRKFVNYNNSSATSLIGIIHRSDNVVASWVTPIFDFGTITYSKNINSISIQSEVIINGEVIFGCKTKNNSFDFNVQGVSVFNFEDIDFNRFTFETSDFARSYTKVKRVKNFNFAQFYFKSNNEYDLAVNQIAISYTIGRKNKGVR